MLVGIEKPETIVVWLPVLFVCLFHVSKECFHHRHALVDASLVCVAIGSVCERWIRMPQDAGKRYNIRALLYPVGGECVTQCMHTARGQADLLQNSTVYTVQVVPV